MDPNPSYSTIRTNAVQQSFARGKEITSFINSARAFSYTGELRCGFGEAFDLSFSLSGLHAKEIVTLDFAIHTIKMNGKQGYKFECLSAKKFNERFWIIMSAPGYTLIDPAGCIFLKQA